MKTIQRTETIHLPPNPLLSRMCHLAKNLYNEANYIVRQEFINNDKFIGWYEVDKILNGNGSNPSDNYRELPSVCAQKVLTSVDRAWLSFFRACKEYKGHPDTFLGRPKLPSYKKKDGDFVLFFTNQSVVLKGNILMFPRKLDRFEVKTRLPDDTNIQEVRIISKSKGFKLEIVYETNINPPETDKTRIIGIDFGMKNIITIANNFGVQPIVVKDDGKGIKSINQFFNKEMARLKSIYDKQGVKDGAKLKTLKNKRDNKVNDYIHKLSRFIINFCVENDVGTIVFGYNPLWKQNVNMGRRNNQTFTQIPYHIIIEKTRYKAEEAGIDVILQEESHTSKCSFLDDEPIEHHEVYLGKRTSRGIFKSRFGVTVNADVNAAYNIIKKAIPEAFEELDVGRIGGCALHPVRHHFMSDEQIPIGV